MPTQWESLANEHILGIAPYEPGKPIEELERELGVHNAIKLASNENPLPPSDRVQKAILATLNHLNRYPDGRDRKSTRLNSSHSQISYAVFCLKKKKNKKPSDHTHCQRTLKLLQRASA